MKSCGILLLLCILLGGAGCLHHTKSNPAMAAQVEETFKQRWIAKRMADLQTSGVTDPREARRQATDEFYKKYPYLTISKNPQRMEGELQ